MTFQDFANITAGLFLSGGVGVVVGFTLAVLVRASRGRA